jgi:hypothetical protein
MKALITIAIIFACLWVVRKLEVRYEQANKEERSGQPAARQPAVADPTVLSGMPPSLENALQAAQKQGAEGLGNFLRQYAHVIRDPRLAAIELDYVVLLSLKDPVEARRIFQAVQQRTLPSSPVYERVKKLEKNYQ